MRHRILQLFIVIFALVKVLSSCTNELDSLVSDLEGRVSKLEALCSEMNRNISALQSIVTAMQSGDYITSVSPITTDGVTVGYTISFAKGDPITIYHGKDGKDGTDGHTPVIGVKQDADGVWYWTVDGQWILDLNNQKVKAVGINGADGKDGTTPQLKIEDGYWYVSTNKGQTWTRLGKATGEDGKNGDTMFQSVNVTDTDVTFVTTDGQTFVVKRAAALSIVFDAIDLVVMAPNSVRDIHYSINSGVDDITIEALGGGEMKANIVKTDAKTGILRVKSGTTIDEYSKVVVLVSNGCCAIMRTLVFEEVSIKVEESTVKEISDEGGTIELEFFSNVDCDVVIPDEAQGWISVVPESKTLTRQKVALQVAQNAGTERKTVVSVVSNESPVVSINYEIRQIANRNEQLRLEREALIMLYNAGEGYKWPDLGWGNWNTDAPVSEWQGVTVDSQGSVVSLFLSPFHGEIPASIGAFSQLESLSIFGEFRGAFPEAIMELSNLRFLDISFMGIGGIVENGLSGEIDFDWSPLSRLEVLKISGQNLTGPLPESWGTLSQLRQLSIHRCAFSGSLPGCLSKLSNLESLQLVSNHFSGGIPKEWGSLCNLKELILTENYLCGILPNELINLTKLETLDLGGYVYEDERAEKDHHNSFSGDISFLSKMPCLRELKLGYNCFSGVIPDELWDLPILEVLDLKGNAFSGTIPRSIGKCNKLQSLRLGNNCLTGDIPDELWEVRSLRSIDFTNSFTVGPNVIENHNHLSGLLSPKISQLENLEVFSVMNNQLEGPIPESITSLDHLRELKLYRNNFFGALPDGMKDMNELITFECLYNRLTGVVSKELSAVIQKKSWWVTPQQDGYGFSFDIYSSTDYSQHETVKVLQKSTVGKGIDIILAGDAYVDTDISSGEYDYAMNLMYEALFEKEPFKSFKDCFNVYEVVLVSNNDTEYGETALKVKRAKGIGLYYDFEGYSILNYLHQLVPDSNYDEVIISVVTKMDSDRKGECGGRVSICSACYATDEEIFRELFQHETIGHAFGKLADEYYSSDGKYISEEAITYLKNFHNTGRYLNVDITCDPNLVLWSRFLSIPRYYTEGIGIYEGGYTYNYGVWRPSLNSIMNGGSFFNAPSREIIYKRIHTLAYGPDWEYSFEDFLQWDQKNIEQAGTKSSMPISSVNNAHFNCVHFIQEN